MLLKFIETFQDKLGQTHRWLPFRKIVEELESLNRPVFILETGTARKRDNWHGDGQSTLIWNWIAKESGGGAISVDIDPNAVALAKSQCPNIRVVCSDSIMFLSEFDDAAKIDFLYLDSYDFDTSSKIREMMSSLHHIGELAAIYERLSPGCLIAVDDCHAIDRGKHLLVQEFFDRIGIEPIFRSYVTIWKKP